jgi:RNA polymerase sigma factor (sigma-70 family)
MNVHITYKLHKTSGIEKEINHLLEKLDKRLQVFRPELVHLKGLVEETSPPRRIAVSLNLRLPTGQLAAQRSAPTPAAAVKASFDDLLQQITKHKALLRSPHKWERRRSTKDRSTRQVPFEQTLAALPPSTASADDIRSYVNANLNRLERFVERELYFRQESAQVSADSVSREEVVDEAIVRALDDNSEKPERLALEPWLYRLAIRAMDDLASAARESDTDVHLAQSARRPNVRASDEPSLQFHQPDETLSEENVIADRRIATPEDIASSDEMIDLVQSALSAASRSDREAFILHAMEGFTVEEVAAITGCGCDAVRLSIASARMRLRQSSALAWALREKSLRRAASA